MCNIVVLCESQVFLNKKGDTSTHMFDRQLLGFIVTVTFQLSSKYCGFHVFVLIFWVENP